MAARGRARAGRPSHLRDYDLLPGRARLCAGGRRLVEAKKSEGFTAHPNGRCSVRTVVGIVEVTSPYLRHPVSTATARPAKDSLGLSGAMKTPAVERALTDFGAEESFANAARRFEEHYGQEVGRTSVLRVVEGVAREADKYVSDRLEKAKAAFEEPPSRSSTRWPAAARPTPR